VVLEKKQMNRNINRKNRNNRNKKKRKMKLWKKVVLAIVLILLIAGGIFAYKVQKNGGGMTGMLATMIGHDENTKKNLGEFRILVLGISTDQEGVELTDTIIVASYNPNTQKATLLSIPRDTYTGKNSAQATAYEKINALYNRTHGPEATLDAVNRITGLNIEYYVVVETEALIKLVDVIGGVTFNVPIDMNYDDVTQDLHIHLKAGEQLLDGDKAEQLVRYRHDNPDKYGRMKTYPVEYGDNDTGRMRTQREFIMQVVKQTAKPENIFKLGEILNVAEQYVKTNIDFNVAKDYIPYIVEFSSDNIVTGTLPGVNTDKNSSRTWVFVHNEKETKKLVQELFYDRDLEEIDETTDEVNGNEISTNTTDKISKSDIKLEVLNATGNNEILQNAVDELKTVGYNVTRTGSTNEASKTTIVNKKEAKYTLLNNIRDTLGVGTISTSQSSSSKVDVTIILGKDYKQN